MRDRPATPRERLATTLARLSSQGIQEVLALAVDDTQVVVVRGRGRPEALDGPARKKVLLLLTTGYTRALAAAELASRGARSTARCSATPISASKCWTPRSCSSGRRC